MSKNRLSSNRVRAYAGLALSASVLLVALGAVTTASAAPRVATVTLAAQSGAVTTGTGGSVTYAVTVAKGNTFSLTADLTVTGLPTGATATFSTNPLVWGSFLPVGATRTSTLTITTTGATPAGVTDFAVKATRTTDAADSATGTGTLTVLAGSANTQTISFAPLADRTVGGAPFTVNATASSGLPVSFAASGNCTVDVALVTLGAAGSCTITASQAGDSAFTAATPVQRTFSILATDAGIDLYAVGGSTTIAGQTMPVWGYSTTNGPVSRPGGPTLVVTEDQQVTIRVHNQLAERTALLVEEQAMVPDLTGVAPGGTKLYTFTPNRPGTYLYEAGLLPNAQHQTAMGLYGTLIVQPHDQGGNPIATRAYSDVATAFDKEAVLVLSEIDPALNTSADPATFDMRKYKPKYFLINGKAYPDTDPIASTPVSGGDKVLLRYVNAGIDYHSMAVLGAHQSVIALDGNQLAYARRFVAETFGPGQTTDAIVTAPAASGAVNRLAVYDSSLQLHNSNAGGFGGMLAFLEVAAATGGGDTIGPVTSAVAYGVAPCAANTLCATISDATTGNSNVSAAEYYVDSVSGPGTPVAPFAPSGSVNVTAPLIVPPGQHTLYVRGRDSVGNWGAFSSVLVSGGDAVGPTTKTPKLTPSSTNGSVPVAVHATGDDTASGGSNIKAAEYWIDGGAHVAMTVNAAAPVASLDGTIDSATVAALSPGTHVVSIRSEDAANNWGDPVTVDLVRVATTGPTVLTPPGVVAAPNPNNGALPINASSPAVRVTATLTSSSSNIAAAEAFLCTQANTACAVGASGTGIPLLALDGTFSGQSEATYTDIPLITINALSSGDHTIYVHGRDAAGNWGSTSSTILVIDRVPPAIQSITRVDPNPTSAASVQFLVTFSEAVKGITAANLAIVSGAGSVGAAITAVTGSGATRTVTVTTGPGGGGTFGLNLASATDITDLAGNALPTSGLPFVGQVYTQPSPALFFSTAGNTNPPGVSGTADDADVYSWSGTAFSRAIDVTAITAPLPTGANVDGLVRVDATHFYLSFSGNVTIPVPGPDLSVADEDVVYYNAGSWSLFFDGSANGVAGTDLDAISIVGGTLYFSTDDNDVMPGTVGAGDDADIYRWNGGSSYTRMVDASAVGWSTSNVDGLVWVDATHVYVSYSSDTNVPGIGAVQDEDIVRNNGGTWSVYFNGTARGLTSGNLDIDAFDLP